MSVIWTRKIQSAITLLALALSPSACRVGPECDPGSTGFEIRSPNGKKIARQYETYCGAFGGASHGWHVALRDRGERSGNESRVFIQFSDYEPAISWNGDSLLVEIRGTGTIDRSLHSAKNVSIQYKMSKSLNYKAIVADFHEQKSLLPSDEDWAENTEKRQQAFLAWASEEANLSVPK